MHRCIFIIAMTAAALLLTACKAEQSVTLGTAFHQQRINQQVNPGYAKQTPVTGLDGKLAEQAGKQYQAPTSKEKGSTLSLELGSVTPKN